jgi:gliding motility-associatede transport system auxiliary component
MNAAFLKARQTKYGAYAVVYVLVVLAILVVANLLANRYNKTVDATSNKRYSLSEQTAKIVKGLNQPATVTYYGQSTRFREVKDQLDPYADLSTRVHVEYVDAVKKPQLAAAAGVKSEGAVIVQIGTRKEEAKSLSEEGITGAFIRVLKNKTRTVCFVEGNGEHRVDDSQAQGYSRFKEVLGRDGYESKSIDLLQKAEVPADCTVIVVGGPRNDYPQPQVDGIKKYVEDGGRALFLLNPPLKMGRMEFADNEALGTVLNQWGVIADKDLIFDTNPIGQITGLGPEVALVMSYESHPIVSEMKGSAMAFPLSRSLETKNGAKTTVEKLFSSSGSSLATTKLNDPNVNLADPSNSKGPMTLAAAGTYNTGKENTQGRFVVMGSSEWAVNSFLPMMGNRNLAANTINWLASDEDLISIRPKDRDDRGITLTTAQTGWIRSTSLYLLPLLVVLFGVSVWWRRR